MRSVRVAVFALVAAIIVAGRLPVGATAAQRSYDITTRIVEQAPSVGEFDGALQLRISADGIISGYYRPADDARFVPVNGSATGNGFWLEIGTFASRPLRFSGTFNGGTIDAHANGFIHDDGRMTGLELLGTPSSR